MFVVNDGQVESGENVTVQVNDELANIIIIASEEFDIDPTLIVAVMAHESRFDSNATSGAASGIMQMNNTYFPYYAENNKRLIAELGGDYTDITDNAANVIAWGDSYSDWVDIYGDTMDSLKALRQGYKGARWTTGACQNAEEFMEIKRQLEENIK